MMERKADRIVRASKARGGRFSSRANGLYRPEYEYDACGIGLIAHMKGEKSHAIVQDGLKILVNLTHRGAVGADPLAGDGAGLLVQIPHAFFLDEAKRLGFTLPEPGFYGVGQLFMPHNSDWRKRCEELFAEVTAAEGLTVLGWRDVPVNNAGLPQIVLDSEPVHRQVFIGRGADIVD